MSAQPPPASPGFLGRWILATSAGSVGIFALGLLIENIAPTAAGDYWTVAVFAVGAAIGLLQWLVLRNQIPEVTWWILATGAGWAIARAAAVWLHYLRGTGLVIGAVLGLFQGPLLWRDIRRSVEWLLASTVAWTAGWFLSVELGVQVGGAWGEGLGSIAGGAVAGAITGLAFVRLSRRRSWASAPRRKAKR